jgi:hypothetical protein
MRSNQQPISSFFIRGKANEGQYLVRFKTMLKSSKAFLWGNILQFKLLNEHHEDKSNVIVTYIKKVAPF